MKILYFVNGLNYKGGIARIVADKANYLADLYRYEVSICVLNGELCSAYGLSDNVNLVSLPIRPTLGGGDFLQVKINAPVG